MQSTCEFISEDDAVCSEVAEWVVFESNSLLDDEGRLACKMHLAHTIKEVCQDSSSGSAEVQLYFEE